MDSRNLSVFSWMYWKTKIQYIWSIIYLFILCFFPLPEKRGVQTRGATPDGRGGYDNRGGFGKTSRGFGCSSGG